MVEIEKNSLKSKSRGALLSGSLLAFIFFLSLVFSSCASVEKPISRQERISPRKENGLYSKKDEMSYAKKIASEIEREGKIIKDEFLNGYLDELGKKVVSQASIKDFAKDWRWSFQLIESPDVNAFCAIGGQVYVNSGLVEATESESELAGVLAFETAHLLTRNLYQRLLSSWKRQGDIAPDELISGERGWEQLSRFLKTQGGAFSFFSRLKYDSDQVEKADKLSLSKIYDAGYNPQGFFALLSKLGKMDRSGSFWMGRNPWNQKRQDKLSDFLKLLPSFSFPEDKTRFKRFKVHLESLTVPPLSAKKEEAAGSVQEVIYRITVPGNVDWTDTSLDVEEGQGIYFKASGVISLQKGNPLAQCGPDGYNLKTRQQPILDRNLGTLIGKVVLLISVEIIEETGEEIRHELVEQFYIGSENKISIPLNGRLFLGVNENVVGDNSGEYRIEIHLIKE